ncbi:DNA cytosine methyltransferase [Johnsonella ignava]|uniref:DNA cytosine methyltransferase n=1 Tax=Johnsonella ignava TaxID=43995 RepID=UPI000A0712AB|nr:DNA cytosine methyltransferase [Johnsonella ignava]
MENKTITLGSLFDGIGIFPLAASHFGIEPVCASEIDKNAIAVTKRHFPKMKHLGDIKKIDVRKTEPVDIIAFGSPCQNLSLIGDRMMRTQR